MTMTMCIFKLHILNNFKQKVAKITDNSHIAFIQNNHFTFHHICLITYSFSPFPSVITFSEPFEAIQIMPLLNFSYFTVQFPRTSIFSYITTKVFKSGNLTLLHTFLYSAIHISILSIIAIKFFVAFSPSRTSFNCRSHMH